MASTTPYQQNDYQAVSTFRPYNLPVNDIFKALSAQDRFWKEGAMRVKGVYDQALGLKLTNAQNREIRDNYLKEAQKRLTELSSMDLSDADVQRKGMDIFKPLFRDEGIVTDDEATRHIQKVNEEALSYRSRDNGKFYSSTNHKYALQGSEEFATSEDRFAGKDYLRNKKEYELFYDPSSELSTIMKNCKPDKGVNSSVQGYYIETMSSESLSAEKVNTCIDGGISDKARRQLQINGAVAYRDRPNELRDKYVPHLQGTRRSLSEQRAAIQGVLANRDNLKNLKPADLAKLGFADASEITPEVLKGLEDNITAIDGRMVNLDNTISKLITDDFSPITGENFEPVASAVFSRDWMQNVSEGFSYDFSTREVKADPIQMMFYQQGQLNARQEDDQSHDKEIKQLELDASLQEKLIEAKAKKKENGEFTLADLTPNDISAAGMMNAAGENQPFSSVEKGDSYEALTTKRQEIAQLRSGLNRQLDMQIGNPYEFGTPEAKQFRTNWKLTAKTDPVKEKILAEYDMQMDNYVSLEDLYKNVQESVDSKIAPLGQESARKIGQLPTTSIRVNGTSVPIQPQDLVDGIAGKSPKVKIIKGDLIRLPGDEGKSSTVKTPDRIFINGQEILREERLKLEPVIEKINGITNNTLLEQKRKREELMQEETVIQRMGYNFPQLNDDKSVFKQRIAQQLRIPKNHIDNITIGQTDANGKVVITLQKPAKETDFDYEGAMQRLKGWGAVDNEVMEDGSVIISGVSELDAIDENNLSSIMEPYIRSLESRANPTKTASTGYIRSGNGGHYRLEILKTHTGGYSYKIVDQEKPTSPVLVLSNRDEALSRFRDLLNRNQQQVSTR